MRLAFYSCVAAAAALSLAGCAGGSGSNLTTSSVTPQSRVAAKPRVKPVCSALSAKIVAVRQEGTPARVHAVATGKTRMVNIKRASLAKVAELDRLNREFQMKCSTVPVQQTAAAHVTAAAPRSTLAPRTANSAANTIAKAKAADAEAKRHAPAATSPILPPR